MYSIMNLFGLFASRADPPADAMCGILTMMNGLLMAGACGNDAMPVGSEEYTITADTIIINAPNKTVTDSTPFICLLNRTDRTIILKNNSPYPDLTIASGAGLEYRVVGYDDTKNPVEDAHCVGGGACSCCCVHPSSLVCTQRGDQPIREVVRGDTVYTESGEPVTVSHCIRFLVPSDQFTLIKQHAVRPNVPANDLLIRDGHPVVINGVESECQDLCDGSQIVPIKLDEPVHVYTLCTKQRVAVMIEGMEVMTYAKHDFLKYAVDRAVPYVEQ